MTPDRRGVQCDLCGSEYRESFTYYSFVIDEVVVEVAQSRVDPDKRYLDIDVCNKCMEDIKTRMKAVIAKNKKKPNKVPKSIKDQWSSKT